MNLLQDLLEAKRTPWEKLNSKAETRFGEFGFATLESDDAASLIDMKQADKIAQRLHGKGFMSLPEKDMRTIINTNPKLVK